MSDKVDFKAKKLLETEKPCTMIKVSLCQEDIAILNVYA